jgi:CheY-like chemotaxis protein
LAAGVVEVPAPDDGDAVLSERMPLAPIDVLCIEDNPANLRLIEGIFARQTSIRLLSALAPGLGLELARTHQPALILLDINLPDMDGYEVMRCLREHDATRQIPVLAISANAMPKDIERGKAAGFVAYLTKPIDVIELLRTVSRLLEAQQAGGLPPSN